MPSVQRRFERLCDAKTRRGAPAFVGVSNYTVWKALAGKGLDEATHDRIVNAIERFEAEERERLTSDELEARAAEARLHAVADAEVERLRKTGMTFEQARRIVRKALLCVAV